MTTRMAVKEVTSARLESLHDDADAAVNPLNDEELSLIGGGEAVVNTI